MFKRITPQTIADWGERIYIRFLELTKRFTSTQIMALLAVIVGVLAGLGTCLFELLLYGIKAGLTHWFPVEQSYSSSCSTRSSVSSWLRSSSNTSSKTTFRKALHACCTPCRAKIPTSPPQLLDFGRRRCDHHRIRRFGRSRGPDRPDGCGHRVERQPPGPPELQKHHPAALLRRGGSPRSHLQSPDHGRGFRARNSDARSHLAHGRTAADLFDHGRRHRTHDQGIRPDYRHFADSRRRIPAQPNSAFRPAGYLLRADVLLLHHGQCPSGAFFKRSTTPTRSG